MLHVGETGDLQWPDGAVSRLHRRTVSAMLGGHPHGPQSLGLGSEPTQGVPADGMHGWRVEPSWVLWVVGLHSPLPLVQSGAHSLLGPGRRNRNSTSLKVQGLCPDFRAGKRNPQQRQQYLSHRRSSPSVQSTGTTLCSSP